MQYKSSIFRINKTIIFISIALLLWQTYAAETPPAPLSAADESSQTYLSQQPELVGFLNGAKLGPESIVKWSPIVDNVYHSDVFYLVTITDPASGEVVASRDLAETFVRLGSLENVNKLIDKKKYNLKVVAYLDKTALPPDEKTNIYQLVFDKFPGVESELPKEHLGKIVQPLPGIGLKTENGVLLQWEPKLENHLWAIRVVCNRMDATRVMAMYSKEELKTAEYLLEQTLFAPEDEDALVEVSITSAEGIVTPIETNFRINNVNHPPAKPMINVKDGYLLQWSGAQDPDYEKVSHRLVVEKPSPGGSATEPVKKVKISGSGSLDMRKGLQRSTDYSCYIVAEDSWGAASRSETVYINMDQPPVKPVFDLKLDFRHLSKAKYLIINHFNYNYQANYTYYVKYFFEDGSTYPDKKSWLTEKPHSRKKNRTKIKLRRIRKRVKQIAVVVQTSNKLGETADSIKVVLGNPKSN